jgi:hypothetical protein
MSSNNNHNNIPVYAVPAYPINNANHSSGPSSEAQLPNTYNYYDNNYLITNYVSFINNYINTMNHSIDYYNNSSNVIRQMYNELGRMHYNLDYYYYNLYRNNLRVQNEYNNRQYYNNISENGYGIQEVPQEHISQEEVQEEQNFQEQSVEEQQEQMGYQVNDLNLEFNEEYYQELSNININKCIDENVNNVTFSSIGNPVNNTCAISQDEFDVNEEVSVFNYCGHIFKKEPLNTWLLNHHTCPNCRFNILTNSNLIKYNNRNETFKYFFTIEQFRYILANNIINRFFNNDTSNNTMSFIIRR